MVAEAAILERVKEREEGEWREKWEEKENRRERGRFLREREDCRR